MGILVTGAAGFIGFHLCKSLLESGNEVIGMDNLNDYYDPNLKLARLAQLGITSVRLETNEIDIYKNDKFTFIKADLTDSDFWELIAQAYAVTAVIHLAAQAGVRYSLENPKSYVRSNVEGFLNVLEFCRYQNLTHLIYASSSSVYGMDSSQPFSEEESCIQPVSLYAATKKSNELMAYTYSHLFGIHSMALRFFTVYGPWGRPDMAPYIFTKAAYEGKTVKVFNYGKQKRDFTYIDDIIEGIQAVFNQKTAISGAEICNIGQGRPSGLEDFLNQIESSTGNTIKKEYISAQPGDVETTYSDITKLSHRFNFKPKTNIRQGVAQFVRWYKDYHGL